tara:strand:+ start:251 stop:409 length:159 start_codon:yes stop_codon:yes gene_type:complete
MYSHHHSVGDSVIERIEEIAEAIKEFVSLLGYAMLIGFIYYTLGSAIWNAWF